MAGKTGAQFYTTPMARDGKGTPAKLTGKGTGIANPALQDKDADNMSDQPMMKATAHMADMQFDGGVNKWGVGSNDGHS